MLWEENKKTRPTAKNCRDRRKSCGATLLDVKTSTFIYSQPFIDSGYIGISSRSAVSVFHTRGESSPFSDRPRKSIQSRIFAAFSATAALCEKRGVTYLLFLIGLEHYSTLQLTCQEIFQKNFTLVKSHRRKTELKSHFTNIFVSKKLRPPKFLSDERSLLLFLGVYLSNLSRRELRSIVL